MQSSTSGTRNLIGLLLVAIGVLFLLDTLDVFGEDSNISGSIWPILIIAIGFIGWMQRDFKLTLGPLLVMTVGALLLADSLIEGDVWRFWPILLIIIGLWFFRRSRRPSTAPRGELISGPGVVNSSAVFGGAEQRVTGEFHGGRVSAFMGGGTLNLLEATLPEGGAVLDVTAIMGSYEIKVPATWNVFLNTDTFLGSTEDKRNSLGTSERDKPGLEVTGSVLMGSIEIKP